MTDVDRDIRRLRQAIRHRPHEVAQHLWLLAALALKNGLLTGAEPAFRKMYELRPDWTQLHNDVIEYWCDHGRNTDQIVAVFESARSRASHDVVIGYACGLAFQAAGRVDDAIALYLDLVRIDARLAVAHHNLALAYRFAGRHKESEAEALEAVRLAPTMAEPHFVLGGYYAFHGPQEKATFHTRRYMELAYPYLEKHTATAELSQGFFRDAAGEGPFTRFLRKWRPRS